jgi:hypothetical protein
MMAGGKVKRNEDVAELVKSFGIRWIWVYNESLDDFRYSNLAVCGESGMLSVSSISCIASDPCFCHDRPVSRRF